MRREPRPSNPDERIEPGTTSPHHILSDPGQRLQPLADSFEYILCLNCIEDQLQWTPFHLLHLLTDQPYNETQKMMFLLHC